MGRIILITVVASLFGTIFPVSHRGLEWEKSNCWMISSLSALINTKPLYDALKDYEVQFLSSDSPSLKAQKEILQEFIKIMKESYKSGKDSVSIDDFYNKFFEIYNGSKFQKNAYNVSALTEILEYIFTAYPKLQKIFFKRGRDSVDVRKCYQNNTLQHCVHYDDILPEFVYTLFRPGVCPTIDLIKIVFGILKLDKKRSWFPMGKAEICKQSKCGDIEGYFQERFYSFKKSPHIIIFESPGNIPGPDSGIRFPESFKIPSEFFTDPRRASSNKYNIYSIIANSSNHYWNYSRDVNSDNWYKYSFSSAEQIHKEVIDTIIKTGFPDGSSSNAINYLFYEMENYEQYDLEMKLIDLKDYLVDLKTKLFALKSKLELLRSTINA
jgi:hypothetical protein